MQDPTTATRAPGKRTAVQREGAGPIVGSLSDAAGGVRHARGTLPHLATVQRLFGRHDVSDVKTMVGGEADAATKTLQARAYAMGDAVAFHRDATDLHTVAHEAAHVVQQRAGVVAAGIGAPNSPWEAHADAVADAVVRGASAEPLLAELGEGKSTSMAVQLDAAPDTGDTGDTAGATEDGGIAAPESDATTADNVLELLSYGMFHPAITDADATEAFRLIAGAPDKAAIWARVKAEVTGDRLWGNLPKTELTHNLATTASVFSVLSSQETLTQMTNLLSYGMTDWGVDDREFTVVTGLLKTMDSKDRMAFILSDGGKWFSRLAATQIPGEPPPVQGTPAKSWQDWTADSLHSGKDFAKAVAADPAGALHRVGTGSVAALEFLAAGWVDLNAMQSAAGGSLDGITMDTRASNAINLDAHPSTGAFDVNIPDLAIASIDTVHHGFHVESVGGRISNANAHGNLGNANDPSMGLSIDIANMSFNKLQVTAETARPNYQVAAGVFLDSLHLVRGNPSPAIMSGAPEDIVGLIKQDILDNLEGVVEWATSIATKPSPDGATIVKQLTENFGKLGDYEASAKLIRITDASYRTQNADLTFSEVGKVAEVTAVDIASSYEARETVSVLTDEKARLVAQAESRKLGGAELERLEWIDHELADLQVVAARATTLAAKQATGPLSVSETDELIACNNQLKTRVLKVKAGIVEVKGAAVDGQSVADVRTTDATAIVAGEAVDDGNERTHAEQLRHDAGTLDHLVDHSTLSEQQAASNDAARAAAQNAEAAASGKGAMDDTFVDLHVGSGSVAGLDTRSVSGAGARVDGLDVSTTGGDAGQIHVDAASANDVHANVKGTTVDVTAGAIDGLDASTRDGKIAGDLAHADVAGATVSHHGTTISVASTSVDGASVAGADADARTVDSASVAGAQVRGLAIDNGTAHTSLGSGSVDGASIAGLDARAGTLESAQIAGASMAELDVTHGKMKLSIGSGSVDGASIAGLDAKAGTLESVHAANASMGALGVTNDETMISIASGSVEDLTAVGMDANARTIDSGGIGHTDMGRLDLVDDKTKLSIGSGSADAVTASGMRIDHGFDVDSARVGETAVKDLNVTNDAVTLSIGSGGTTNAQVSDFHADPKDVSGSGSLDQARLADARLSTGDTTVKVGESVLGATSASRNEQDGTMIRTDGASIAGVTVKAGTTAAAVDQGSIGASALALDGDDQLEALRVAGISMSDITAIVHPSNAKTPAPKATGESDVPSIQADALRDFNGTFSASIPVQVTWKGKQFIGVTFDVSAIVEDGVFDVKDIKITSSVVLNAISKIVLSNPIFNLVLNGKHLPGVTTKRGAKVHLEEFAEHILEWTAEAEAEQDDDAGNNHNKRIPIEAGVKTNAIKFDAEAAMGDGTLDVELAAGSAALELDGAGQGANAVHVFTTRLGKSVTATSERLSARSFHIEDANGRAVDADSTGIDGLTINVAKPLSDSRAIRITVENLAVEEIRIGDQSALDPE